MGKVVKSIVGGGGSSGMMGTGRAKVTKREIDEAPFKKQIAAREGQQEEIRVRQTSQADRLQAQAEGKAPSLAEAQLKAATSRSLKQQLAAAQTGRGGSAASRERALMRSSGEARRETAEAATTARLQEQQQAERALAEQLASQRAADIGIAQADRASLQEVERLRTQQDMGIAGLNLSAHQSAAAARGGMFKTIGQGISGAAMSDEDNKKNIKDEDAPKSADKKAIIAHNKRQAKKGKELADKRRAKGKMSAGKGFAKGLSEADTSNPEGVERGEGAAAANRAMAAISDENSKKNTESYNPKSFLDALKAYSYEYKDEHKDKPEAGKGRFLSVMAQDLEKAGPVGESMVMDTPSGKMVDYGKGFGAILAAQAHLNKRLKNIEKKRK